MENLPAVDRSRMHELLGNALSGAGRGRDAAYAYLEAATSTDKDGQIEMRRLAADQLMRSGYVVEALKIIGDLSDSVGVRMVKGRYRILTNILVHRLRTRMRLLLGVPAPSLV